MRDSNVKMMADGVVLYGYMWLMICISLAPFKKMIVVNLSRFGSTDARKYGDGLKSFKTIRADITVSIAAFTTSIAGIDRLHHDLKHEDCHQNGKKIG
jgi:hypothetical protein